MDNNATGWNKFIVGFGILTIISGIYLITQEDYVLGFSGSMVGVFIIFQNKWATKIKNDE